MEAIASNSGQKIARLGSKSFQTCTMDRGNFVPRLLLIWRRLTCPVGVCVKRHIPQPFDNTQLYCMYLAASQFMKVFGWDGRIRTYNLRYQKALPCH